MNSASQMSETADRAVFDIREWLGKGLTWEEYLAGCVKNVERMRSVYRKVVIPEDQIEFFRKKGNMTFVCISEDWCPDCVQNVPFVVRLAEHLPDVNIRLFFRDRNEALMDHYLTAGKKVVPTVVLFNSQLQELGKWAGPSRKAKIWTRSTLIKGRKITEIPRDELEKFGPLYDEKFLNEFYLDTLEELRSVLR